ncbi:MAG: hypothetical protein K2O08_02470 [Clostridia bacterium]|nr:hypothetical protein [Clostridia bacterium]
MKKKLCALLSVVLIVVMACSLAACKPASMFDGNFKKEATAEEAKNMWDSASASMSGDSTETLATASDDDAAIKGWKGVKMSITSRSEMGGESEDSKNNLITDVSASGAYLFDGSAMAVTGVSEGTSVKGDKTESKKLNVGVYGKDKTTYTNIGFGDSALKVKATADLGLVGESINNMISSVSSQFVDTAVYTIGEIVCEMDYDKIVEMYNNTFKAYINDSGDYTRIKYVFTKEMIADLYAGASDEEDFLKMASLGECSIILVSDKATKTFQGAKLDINFTFENNTEDSKSWVKVNMSTSIENCAEVDSSLPSDLDDYKDVKNLTIQEVMEFFQSMNS